MCKNVKKSTFGHYYHIFFPFLFLLRALNPITRLFFNHLVITDGLIVFNKGVSPPKEELDIDFKAILEGKTSFCTPIVVLLLLLIEESTVVPLLGKLYLLDPSAFVVKPPLSSPGCLYFIVRKKKKLNSFNVYVLLF